MNLYKPESSRPNESSLIDKYRNYYSERDLFTKANSACSAPWEQLRMELPSGKGQGWMEMIQVNRGLTIGLCDYHLNDFIEDEMVNVEVGLGFEILLSGRYEVFVPGRSRYASVRGGELWMRRGKIGNLFYRQQPGSIFRGIGIEVPPETVEAWLDGAPDHIARTLDKLMHNHGDHWQALGDRPLASFSLDRSDIANLATQLLAMPRNTFCELLQFESRALDLLARLLSLDYCSELIEPCGRLRHRAAIDEAVDILCAEWVAPPTIAALARRVGLNECYLKAQFRQYIGCSIGEYVRKLRMERALGLIESGKHSILETAYSVGYSNPSHFSAAFKRFYGRLPSCYLARS